MTDMGWIVSVILLLMVIALITKIHILHRSLKEIDVEMKRFLSQDTNVPISVSSEDKHVRKLAEEINVHLLKLRKLRMQYVNGDKELKEAITNISHDLRTPLTAIYGYIDLIEKLDTDIEISEKEKSDKMTKYMKQIKERTETLKQLTEELFTYSVIASVPDLEYEEVNVNRVIEEAMVGFYGAFKEAGIEPYVKISEKVCCKRLDKMALLRVLNNIISNAIKYSDGDFFVELDDEGKITFINTATKLSLVEVRKMFDRFYTVDASRKSTGIGLSIAKVLVERMSGSIEAEYQDDKLYIMVKFD